MYNHLFLVLTLDSFRFVPIPRISVLETGAEANACSSGAPEDRGLFNLTREPSIVSEAKDHTIILNGVKSYSV